MENISSACNLQVVFATSDEAESISSIFSENQKYLHCEDINSEQWIDLLCVNDPDEKHFLILQNSIIVGYMKINGLIGKETAWLSMLIIAEKYKRQGIGAYAISFAEKFAKNSGFENLCIQTTSDNEPEKSLYRKCGYNGKLYTEKGRWYFTKRLY